jgi:phosphoserine phosphatase RsbU/P
VTQFHLAAGDRIFFFTDGLTELRRPNGSELGIRRLMKMFQQTRGKQTEQAARDLVAALEVARDRVEQQDDITFALVDYNPPPA